MILQGDFYYIKNIEVNDSGVNAELELNANHIIYKGHFPGQPVTPGVCMMQIIKEIIETALAQRTTLVKADEMKFLLMIVPGDDNVIEARLKYTMEANERVSVTAVLARDTTTYFKFKGSFLLQDCPRASAS